MTDAPSTIGDIPTTLAEALQWAEDRQQLHDDDAAEAMWWATSEIERLRAALEAIRDDRLGWAYAADVLEALGDD